jgi:hypothetical protein
MNEIAPLRALNTLAISVDNRVCIWCCAVAKGEVTFQMRSGVSGAGEVVFGVFWLRGVAFEVIAVFFQACEVGSHASDAGWLFLTRI